MLTLTAETTYAFFGLGIGAIFLVGGIFGKRFSGPLGRGAVPVWYGRIWCIGLGLILGVLASAFLLSALGYHPAMLRRLQTWESAQCYFLALFEAYNGLGLSIVGLIGAVYSFNRRDWRMFWILLACFAAGLPFAEDGLWRLIKGCGAGSS